MTSFAAGHTITCNYLHGCSLSPLSLFLCLSRELFLNSLLQYLSAATYNRLKKMVWDQRLLIEKINIQFGIFDLRTYSYLYVMLLFAADIASCRKISTSAYVHWTKKEQLVNRLPSESVVVLRPDEARRSRYIAVFVSNIGNIDPDRYCSPHRYRYRSAMAILWPCPNSRCLRWNTFTQGVI